MTDEILATLIEAIAVYKEKIADLEDTIDLIKEETKTNQDEVVKVKETLEKQIEDTVIATDKMLSQAMYPESNIDFVKAEIRRYLQANITQTKQEIKKDEILEDLKRFIRNNIFEFSGLNGRDGRDGADAVGIKDIKKDKDYLTIYLTDGSQRRFSIPKTTIHKGVSATPSGINFNAVPQATKLLASDEMIILRGNKPHKVKMNVLIDLFGVSPNVYIDNNGAAYADINGNYFTTN